MFAAVLFEVANQGLTAAFFSGAVVAVCAVAAVCAGDIYIRRSLQMCGMTWTDFFNEIEMFLICSEV